MNVTVYFLHAASDGLLLVEISYLHLMMCMLSRGFHLYILGNNNIYIIASNKFTPPMQDIWRYTPSGGVIMTNMFTVIAAAYCKPGII